MGRRASRSLHDKSKLSLPAAGFLVIGGAVVLLGLWLSSPNSTPYKVLAANATALDLLGNQDWSHLAGATRQSDGVHIRPLGRAIVNQDGSGGQPNPPVNVRGPQINFTGDFQINFGLDGLSSNQPASFYIYGGVPIIYDEWRYQPPQLKIDATRSNLTVYQWNGRSDNPVANKTWHVSTETQADVSVARIKNKLVIRLNNRQLGLLPERNLFASRRAWFGADAALGSNGWTLKSLSANSLNQGRLQFMPQSELKLTDSNRQNLRNLSSIGNRHLPIGAAVANYALFSDPDYRKIVASQFSLLTPENELKAQFIHPQPNIYSFTEVDSLVAFAQANGMSLHGHNLVFSEANPHWMQVAPPVQRQQIMTDHITTVMRHFGGQIGSWDVVDEPLSDQDTNYGDSRDLRRNIWLAAMGENYIDNAFKTARTANPQAKLYLNEYGLEADGPRWQAFLRLLKRLQARGVPVDGVGFQAHVYEPGDEVYPSILKKHIEVLALMGLQSRISEMDVYGDDPSHQADQYAGVLGACLAEPSCTAINLWGITDKYGSTTEIHRYPLRRGNDLLWDWGLRPKPAYTKLQGVLSN